MKMRVPKSRITNHESLFTNRRRRRRVHLERRQHLFDAWTRGLEPGRQHQRFAKMRGVLVDREPRAVGSELEEHPARLLEVDRLEPEAIDHGRWMVSRC